MPRADAQDEAELIAACVAGDPLAWRRLDSRYRPLVRRVARRALKQYGVADVLARADDVAAEVFAELLANERRVLARFEGRASLSTFIVVITRRKAARLAQREGRSPQLLSRPERVDAREAGPSAQAANAEQRALVRKFVKRLAARDRLALQLYYEGGNSYQEVAKALDIPAAQVGTLLSRARARLGKLLRKHVS